MAKLESFRLPRTWPHVSFSTRGPARSSSPGRTDFNGRGNIGTLTVRVAERPRVSQPAPFSNGRTVVTPDTRIDVEQGGRTRRHSRRVEPPSAGRRPQSASASSRRESSRSFRRSNCRSAAGRSRHSVDGPSRAVARKLTQVSPAQAARSRMRPSRGGPMLLFLCRQRLTARSVSRARGAERPPPFSLPVPAFAQDGGAREGKAKGRCEQDVR